MRAARADRARRGAGGATGGGGVAAAGGFSLVEATVAMVIVSGLLLAVLDAVGGAVAAGRVAAERARAEHVGRELMAEVVTRRYAETDEDTAEPIGPEAGEADPKFGRAGFDDVDDYDGHVDGPPLRDAAGAVMAGFAETGRGAWTRTVRVYWVSDEDPMLVELEDKGLKLIEVRVSRGGRELAVLRALRARAGDAASNLPMGATGWTTASPASFGSVP